MPLQYSQPGMRQAASSGNGEDIHISVIIPCYKPAETVEAAVLSLVNQSSRDKVDIVLVDDCSPYVEDGYQSIVDRYGNDIKIQLMRTPQNCGPGDARQYGFDNAEDLGTYVIFHDADETFVVPDAISRIVDAIEKNPDGVHFSAPVLEHFEQEEPGTWKSIMLESSENYRLSGQCFSRVFLEENHLRFDHDLSFHDEDSMFGNDLEIVHMNTGTPVYYVEGNEAVIDIVWKLDHDGARNFLGRSYLQCIAQFAILCSKRFASVSRLKPGNYAIPEKLHEHMMMYSLIAASLTGNIRNGIHYGDETLTYRQLCIIFREILEIEHMMENLANLVVNDVIRLNLLEAYNSADPEKNLSEDLKRLFSNNRADILPPHDSLIQNKGDIMWAMPELEMSIGDETAELIRNEVFDCNSRS